MIPQNKLDTRQFRKLQEFKTEEESEYTVRGYATKWAPYVLYEDADGPVYERFGPDCFNGADMSDVIFLYDHQGKVLARTSNGTLRVTIDDIGLYVEADLSKSEASREMYNEIEEGLVTKMSWSFKIGEYEYNQETRTIEHKSIRKMYDVSAVGIPANSDTEINARSFGDGVIAKTEAERLEVQRQKLKLAIELARSKK